MKISPLLGTRFAITVRSATLLAELISVTEDGMTDASLSLHVVVVNDVSFGSDDVWPCWRSVDVAFAEGSGELSTDKKLRK